MLIRVGYPPVGSEENQSSIGFPSNTTKFPMQIVHESQPAITNIVGTYGRARWGLVNEEEREVGYCCLSSFDTRAPVLDKFYV